MGGWVAEVEMEGRKELTGFSGEEVWKGGALDEDARATVVEEIEDASFALCGGYFGLDIAVLFGYCGGRLCCLSAGGMCTAAGDVLRCFTVASPSFEERRE